MKTVTITLTIPDGVAVSVSTEGGDEPPFPPPFPAEPTPFRAAARQQPSSAWQEGQQHDPAHKPLKTNARGLFCPTKLQDGSWCPWRAA